ncbi:MAG TPA: SDR family oxidoreductase [Mycobacteriales bacterium]|nr:SDR family oxidoreductase [Mycobacteriales bacterium]
MAHEGHVALVTGGTKGIGAAIAAELLAEGATVVVCGRSEVGNLPTAAGRTATFHTCDVRDAEQVKALVDAVVAEHGRLDVCVHNAGGAPPSDAATASPRFAEKVIGLNLLAGIHVAQAANTVMQRQDSGGVIVMIGSVSGVRPSPGSAVYGAAKAGLHHLVGSLAIEWAPKVRLASVIVGLIRTPDSDDHYGGAERAEAIARTVPLGRMATVEDVARAVAWLSSDAASYVSGTALTLHGADQWPSWLYAAAPEAYAPGTLRGLSEN